MVNEYPTEAFFSHLQTEVRALGNDTSFRQASNDPLDPFARSINARLGKRRWFPDLDQIL